MFAWSCFYVVPMCGAGFVPSGDAKVGIDACFAKNAVSICYNRYQESYSRICKCLTSNVSDKEKYS